jgi:5-methyltetrahydrofolate--homocysteine methyltransferase
MKFFDLLGDKSVVLLDGAIGTQLDKRGLMARGRNNVDAPEAVAEIHRAYADAGCDALTTNTLTMNRIYIETHKVDVPVREVNVAGAKLAREAAGDDQCVLGNLSSTGQLLEPYGALTQAQLHEALAEQAGILTEAGVDALLVETMFDLREALGALAACKESSRLPVLVSIAFQTEKDGGRTVMGDTAEQCARQLTEAGADIVGANCGDLGPAQMATVVATFRAHSDRPILAQPNAGRPTLIDGRTVVDLQPGPFAQGISACIDAGARLVGGCCGTTPEHVAAVRESIEKL